MNRYFASGGEFSLIESLFDESHFSRTGEGLGDDGFILRPGSEETWVVSTDASAEGVHYRLDWAAPEEAMRKALLANLSDINAMGGRTRLAFFNLGAHKDWDGSRISAIGRVLREMEQDHGFRVAGGDTVRKSGETFFAFTVLGRVDGRPLLRSQARPGHRIYLSGLLGESAAGLSLLSLGLPPARHPEWGNIYAAHFRPAPPLGLGPALAALPGPVAAIDVSDGLSSELAHLARQSGCRLVVEWGKLPYDAGLASLPGGDAWKDWVLHGGESYQLLFTGEFNRDELEALAGAGEFLEIGRVEAGSGVGIVDETGVEMELASKGWSH